MLFGLIGGKKKPVSSVNYRRVAARHHEPKCVVCGALWPLEVHHKDRNRNNNKPKNLEWRCREHHLAVHGKKPRYAEIVIRPKPKRKKRWLFLRKG